jgi:hypothetical protein
MTARERLIAPVGFCLAAVLFMFAAIVPTFDGRPLNAAFVPLAIVFGIFGVVAWRKAKRPPPV